MSDRTQAGRSSAACMSCLAHAWLLGALSPPLDYLARDRGRLTAALAHDTNELLTAVGGRRRAELGAALARFTRAEVPIGAGVEAICRHARQYPQNLHGEGAPRLLFAAGGGTRLAQLTERPVVALLGPARASDYGVELAGALARGLAIAGVTVASLLTEGIPAAAQMGALRVGGASLAAVGGGLDAGAPARCRGLLVRVCRHGCAITELPCDCHGRRFGQLAAERVLAELADVAVVIEAGQRPGELAAAEIARSRGRAIASVPGRVSSPLSAGANALLRDGAALVRDPDDVLELLGPSRAPRGTPACAVVPQPATGLPRRLLSLLELVGGGRDTAEALCARAAEPEAILQGLSELELLGLLGRGADGRYLPLATPPA